MKKGQRRLQRKTPIGRTSGWSTGNILRIIDESLFFKSMAGKVVEIPIDHRQSRGYSSQKEK